MNEEGEESNVWGNSMSTKKKGETTLKSIVGESTYSVWIDNDLVFLSIGE